MPTQIELLVRITWRSVDTLAGTLARESASYVGPQLDRSASIYYDRVVEAACTHNVIMLIADLVFRRKRSDQRVRAGRCRAAARMRYLPVGAM